MRLVKVGAIDEVIQGGNPKSSSSDDPGDPGKPPGQEQ
jgi:hypothetical protein